VARALRARIAAGPERSFHRRDVDRHSGDARTLASEHSGDDLGLQTSTATAGSRGGARKSGSRSGRSPEKLAQSAEERRRKRRELCRQGLNRPLRSATGARLNVFRPERFRTVPTWWTATIAAFRRVRGALPPLRRHPGEHVSIWRHARQNRWLSSAIDPAETGADCAITSTLLAGSVAQLALFPMCDARDATIRSIAPLVHFPARQELSASLPDRRCVIGRTPALRALSGGSRTLRVHDRFLLLPPGDAGSESPNYPA
jgi:hypothetical protein